MVLPFFCLVSTLPTLHDRALDTLHEALTVAGGSSLDVCATCSPYMLSLIAYKYIMARLVNPLAILNEIP